jgi:hypothetical protein
MEPDLPGHFDCRGVLLPTVSTAFQALHKHCMGSGHCMEFIPLRKAPLAPS